jgi:ABC-type multidrug transport system ATPase subunit
LENGSILFWDEPESNINPSYISIIVELLLELQRKGVQVFVSTHDYMIASYFEVRKTKNDSIAFHSLSHARKTGDLIYEKKGKFADLKNNAIVSAFDKLLDEIYDL